MNNMKIGDCVKVKKGVLEPDTEKFEISGWQGRIIEIDSLTGTLGVPRSWAVMFKTVGK